MFFHLLFLSYSKDYNSSYPISNLQPCKMMTKTNLESLPRSVEGDDDFSENQHLLGLLLSYGFHSKSCTIHELCFEAESNSFHGEQAPKKHSNFLVQVGYKLLRLNFGDFLI